MNLFSRSLGSALSVAIFGAVANAAVRSGNSTDDPSVPRLMAATAHVFVGVAIAATLLFATVVWMPRDNPLRRSSP